MGDQGPDRPVAAGADGSSDPPPLADDAGIWSAIIDDLAGPGQSLPATLQRLAQRASQSLAATAAIFLVTPGRRLTPSAFWDDDPARLALVRSLFDRGDTDVDTGLLGQVLRSAEPVLLSGQIPVVDGSPYAGYAESARLNSFLLIPLAGSTGEALGLLGLGRHDPQPPLAEDIIPTAARLAIVATQIVHVSSLAQRGLITETALNNMRDAVIAVAKDATITYWNSGAEHLYGLPSLDVLGRPATEVLNSRPLGPEDAPLDPESIKDQVVDRGAWMRRLKQTRADGTEIAVESLVSVIRDETGANSGAVIVNRDISDVIAIGTALRQQELLVQAALDASPLLIAVLDHEGVVLAASRGWAERIGPVGARIADIAAAVIPDESKRDHILAMFQAVAGDDSHRSQADYEMVRADDSARTFAVDMSAVPGVGVTITIADVTERVSRERALSYSATHDLVTRLPNRAVLISRTARALNRAARHQARVGLLFCDLDGFKGLNDRYGHGAGDDVLEFFGARLMESCRATDTVARIGGDEFALLIDDGVGDETVQAIAQRIVAAAAHPLRVPVGDISLTTSVGVVVVTPDTDHTYVDRDVDRLLEQADAAMYEAKRLGKNRWVMFDEAIRARHESRGVLVGDLVRGTQRGEFLLHFQPQFAADGGLMGAEALLRWQHPERGLLEPFDMLQHGGSLPTAMGDWVLGQVAATLRLWRGALPDGFRLGVNLSRTQLLDHNTPDVILDWLGREGVAPRSLRVELPQEALTEDPELARSVSSRLADADIDVAINEFGTGNAQLSDLSRLPVGSIMLGRRLVRDLGRVPAAERLLRGVVAMARALSWRPIATGVETEEQLAIVRGLQCHAAQGFLLGRPVPKDEFARLYLALSAPADGDGG